MKLRIVRVDMNGYWGRDFHPSPSDVGRIVYAVKLDTHFQAPEAINEPVIGDDGRIYADALPVIKGDESDDERTLERVWTVITEDDKVLQLMDFEVEPVL